MIRHFVFSVVSLIFMFFIIVSDIDNFSLCIGKYPVSSSQYFCQIYILSSLRAFLKAIFNFGVNHGIIVITAKITPLIANENI